MVKKKKNFDLLKFIFFFFFSKNQYPPIFDDIFSEMGKNLTVERIKLLR